MVYFLGDWGMGDSDCASYHQHVSNTLQQHQQQQQFHQQQQQQREQQLQQQVGQIAPNLNQLSPIQFGSTTETSTFLRSQSVDTHLTTTATPVSTANALTVTTSPPQNVATSSLVTANLQQLSVSTNNLSHLGEKSLATVNAELNHQAHQQQPQQSHPLASAAAALHQYLGHQRQRSESCAGFTTAASATTHDFGKIIKNAAESTTITTNTIAVPVKNSINIKSHLGATALQHPQLQTQLSKDHLESEDEVALQPLSNQVSKYTS